ncbi:MAG: flagellar filament capping protein FliD [Anaerohalosphaeraceae bacterium]|nr:flagellar filament capping protein FliD [Anaerohalosphaeraceae bacterium]
MGSLRLPGISTGIDTATLIQQLMAVNSRRLATYQVSQKNSESQLSALDELKAKITGLLSASSALADTDDMNIFTVNSSDIDALTLNADASANSGSHSVDVNQLATTETWIQDSTSFNYTTDYVGGGTFIYSYNNQERTIISVDGETTLQDFVNLINNDEENPGITASLLNQGGKYHLMLSGQETGQDFQISINSESTEVWKPDITQANHTFTEGGENAGLSNKIVDLDQFSGTLGASDKITISGKNHTGTVLPDFELAVTSNTTVGHIVDAINEHFDGIATASLVNGQICLKDNTCGSSGLEIGLSFSGDATLGMATMAVSSEGGAVSESIASLGSSSFIETQNAQSSKIRIDGYPSTQADEQQSISITGGTPAEGTFKLSFQGQTTDALNYNATASEIQTALLALSNFEVGDVTCTGSDLPAGTVNIQFSGNYAGTDVENITVTQAETLDAGTVGVTETAKGNEGWISRNSNSVTDALSGVTLNLHDVTETGSPVQITVSRNTNMISQKVQSMVTAYNGLVNEIKAKTAYDTDTKRMGILSRDVVAMFLKSQTRTPFGGILSGFSATSDSFTQASDIGITIDGAGQMEFDSQVFNDAVNDDYKGVLATLGAQKTGNSSSSIVQFYNASDKYTTAGTYHVKVEVDSDNHITSAKIKLSTESEYRDAESWSDGVIRFNSDTDGNGDPLYAESNLQLKVELSEGVYGTNENPIIINVKQGAAGALEDLLTGVLDNDGRFETSVDAIEDRITLVENKIEKEQRRLEKVESRLVQKYARLEKMLTILQQQQGALSMLSY